MFNSQRHVNIVELCVHLQLTTRMIKYIKKKLNKKRLAFILKHFMIKKNRQDFTHSWVQIGVNNNFFVQ